MQTTPHSQPALEGCINSHGIYPQGSKSMSLKILALVTQWHGAVQMKR